MQSQTSKTDLNLWLAFVDEAKTHRLYAAYAIQAMNEGHLEAAEAFMEAAGAEIVHAMTHLNTLGAVKSTGENLQRVVEEEAIESEQTYPRYIAEARAEGRLDSLKRTQPGVESLQDVGGDGGQEQTDHKAEYRVFFRRGRD